MSYSDDRRLKRDSTNHLFETGFFLFAPVSLSVLAVIVSLWNWAFRRLGSGNENPARERERWTKGMF